MRHANLYIDTYFVVRRGAVQVAERSLFLWNNEAIVGLVAQHRAAVVPAVLPALERNARSHWNPAVHGLTVNVRKMFQEMDGPLYEQCRQRFEHEEVIPLACWGRCFRTGWLQIKPGRADAGAECHKFKSPAMWVAS